MHAYARISILGWAGFRGFGKNPLLFISCKRFTRKKTMGIEDELAGIAPEKDMVLTIGVFDGVHLGHKSLIAKVKEQARQKGLLSGVVTFSTHPQEALSPQTKLPCLTDLAQRRTLLKKEGIEEVIVLPFTPELAQLTARQFVSLLKKYLRLRGLVIGPDFALGRNREGDVDRLRTLGREMGFTVTVVPPVIVNGGIVSSTAIRDALAKGDMRKVRRLTGRFFSLHGRVVTGAGRGAKLGFPTANLDVEPQQALPADGIYVTCSYIDNKVYRSVTNIGTRPTFNGSDRTIEVYVIDFSGDLYGQDTTIDIIDRLRDEKRFDSIEALKAQMAEDVKAAVTILNSLGRNDGY